MKVESYVKRLKTATAHELRAAVFELARWQVEQERQLTVDAVNRPRDAVDVVRHLFPPNGKTEQLVGLYLDARNGVISMEVLSKGSLNTTRTNPREILRPAVMASALGFVLVHNHPSGNLEPSAEDVEFTSGVRRAGELLGVELYDHLILTWDGFTSMRERGIVG
jgi:DNA repair protein RadC